MMPVRRLRRMRVALIAAVMTVATVGVGVVTMPSANAAPACVQPTPRSGEAIPHSTCPQPRFRANLATANSSGDQSPAANPGNDMTNHGGKVMTGAVVYNVFWLPSGQHFESPGSAASDTAYENLLNRFFGAVGNSDLMRLMTQYPGSNGTPTLAPTNRVAGSYTDTTGYPRAGSAADPLNDGDIRAAATRAATTNGWATDVNHIYMVYTAFGIDQCKGSGDCNYPATATVANPTSGFNYCAYHNDFGGGPTVYAFMGADSSEQYGSSGCSIGGTANSDAAADSEVSTASHEYFEALTDPQLDAWYHNDTSGEIGDLCAYVTGPAGAVNASGANLYLNNQPYIIQQEWSNAIHGCSLDANTALTTDQPPSVTITKSGPAAAVTGQQISYTITVDNPSDTNASTLTTVTDTLPAGVSFVSSTPGPDSSGPLTWNLGTIPVHESRTITVNATVQHASSFTNCAGLSFDDEYQISSHTGTGCSTVVVSKAATTTALTSSSNPSVFAQSVTFTATVTPQAPATGTPTGSVTFTDNGSPLATVALNASGSASYTMSSLAVGTHPIVATYGGSSDYDGSTDSLSQVVQRQPTTTTVSCVPPTSHVNQAVTCTATVAQTIPNATPITGSVDFYVDWSIAHTSALVGGQAVWTTAFGGGTHSIVAVYLGDTNYAPSTSAPATETVLCDQTITGTHNSLVVTSGTTCVLNAHILGGISVASGATLDVENSVVSGSISAYAPGAFRMCASSTGAVAVTKAGGFVLIGDQANNCNPNTINGSLNASYNTHGLVVIGNTITGGITVVGNSGAGPLPGETGPIVSGNVH